MTLVGEEAEAANAMAASADAFQPGSASGPGRARTPSRTGF